MSSAYVFEDFNQFTLFLYLYMAYADGVMDSTEEEVIKEKTTRLFPHGKDVEELFSQAKTKYESLTNDEIEKIISVNFEHHREKSFTYKYKILADLYEIIIADGIIDIKENQSIEKLKDIIEKSMVT